jgi:hypothetical protein
MGVLNVEALTAKLREYHGNLAACGRAFGVSRSGVSKFVSRRPALQAVVDECREAMKDHAEGALYKAVLAGEPWAVCFFLKCQAKDRGYVERQEVTGKDGWPLQTEVCEVIVTTREQADREIATLTGSNGVPRQ